MTDALAFNIAQKDLIASCTGEGKFTESYQLLVLWDLDFTDYGKYKKSSLKLLRHIIHAI